MWCFDENATLNNFGKNLITLSGKNSQRKRSHALIYVGIYDRVKLHGIPMVTLLAENVLPNQALNSPDLRYRLYLFKCRKKTVFQTFSVDLGERISEYSSENENS